MHRKVTLMASCILVTACSKLDDPSLHPAFDAAQVSGPPAKEAIAPDPERNLLFGDLHIHTSLSTDAYVFGVRSLPEDVYTFARGGTIEHGAGYPIKLSRPLDFVAVTDHAEYMGQARQAELDVPLNRRSLRDLLLNSSAFSISRAWLSSSNFIRSQGFGYGVDIVDKVINQQAWQMTIDAAENHNEPGVFTAFIGYEWSAFAGDPTFTYTAMSSTAVMATRFPLSPSAISTATNLKISGGSWRQKTRRGATRLPFPTTQT